jgi:uncharacterized membrane protein YqaE (UPF0057 family)
MEGFLFLGFILIVYFLPLVVASSRRHKNKSAITVLNLLLGWTLLGWIVALIWAFTDNTEAVQA